MNKLMTILAGVVCVAVASSCVQADVIPQYGANEAHLKNITNYFITPPTGGPSGSGGPAAGPAMPNVGDELRSLYRMDDLEILGNAYWVYNSNKPGSEVTGLLYDLKVSRLVDKNNDGTIDAIYFKPANRNPLTAADDKNGDINRFQGTWGGVVEFYEDATPDLDNALKGGSGPGLWSAGGGPLRPNGTTHADGYTSASEEKLWMSGVFLDLSMFGDQYAQPGEVYSLTRVDSVQWSGLGYVNVFDGSAMPYIGPGTQPMSGPGAQLADVSMMASLAVGTDVWQNGNWQMGSSDPMRFNVTGTPEPATMLLVGTGLVALGRYARRQRRG